MRPKDLIPELDLSYGLYAINLPELMLHIVLNVCSWILRIDIEIDVH